MSLTYSPGLRIKPYHALLHGFTLLELLVVLAVIIVLVAILNPIVGSVRDKAGAAQCVSHLRQIGAATSLYLGDNDNYFFPKIESRRTHVLGKAGTARQLPPEQRPLNPYLGVTRKDDPVGVACCPSDEGISRYNSSGSALNPNQFWDLGLMRTKGADSPIHYSEIENPSRFVIFAEDQALTNAWGESDVLDGWHWKGAPRFNLLFADGHVAPHIVRGGDARTSTYTFFRNSTLSK